MSKCLSAIKQFFVNVFSNNENVGLSSLSKSCAEKPSKSANKDIKFSDILKR
ncbi:hypothetical protein J6S88_06080 [bacterium]|nr:hypothetical protein [bacterium]